jgi:hypothetical protein
MAAVAFELVPEADREAGLTLTALGLLLGAGLYVAADGWLTRDEDMGAHGCRRGAGFRPAGGSRGGQPD